MMKIFNVRHVIFPLLFQLYTQEFLYMIFGGEY